MTKIDLTEYTDKELSLHVFNTEHLYNHIDSICKHVKKGEDPSIQDLKKFALDLQQNFIFTKKQLQTVMQDTLQYYRENYKGE